MKASLAITLINMCEQVKQLSTLAYTLRRGWLQSKTWATSLATAFTRGSRPSSMVCMWT